MASLVRHRVNVSKAQISFVRSHYVLALVRIIIGMAVIVVIYLLKTFNFHYRKFSLKNFQMGIKILIQNLKINMNLCVCEVFKVL
jgi:hypothetical protein